MRGLSTVGLIPAAGYARRLGELPHSKELISIGGTGVTERPVCHGLLETFAEAGLDRACVVLRQGKEDIPARLGNGGDLGLPLEYLEIKPTAGVPFTLASALRRLRKSRIVLGFPDILFRPRYALPRILAHQEDTDADLVLALLPSDNPKKADMVELDSKGKIRRFHIKPRETDLLYTWILATWTPTFTAFFESFLAQVGDSPHKSLLASGELQVSTIIEAAMAEGLEIDSLAFPEGGYLDVGTPDDLDRARKNPAIWFP